jgi:hypothetical protein
MWAWSVGRTRGVTVASQICCMALGALSCRHAPEPSSPTAVACPPPIALDDTWQLRDLGSFRLRLPPGFERGKTLECEHGGTYFARDAERVGWCMSFYGTVVSRANSKGSVTFLGDRATMTCSHDSGGNWSIYISPLNHSSVLMTAYARSRTETTAAQVITALLAAERPH